MANTSEGNKRKKVFGKFANTFWQRERRSLLMPPAPPGDLNTYISSYVQKLGYMYSVYIYVMYNRKENTATYSKTETGTVCHKKNSFCYGCIIKNCKGIDWIIFSQLTLKMAFLLSMGATLYKTFLLILLNFFFIYLIIQKSFTPLLKTTYA